MDATKLWIYAVSSPSETLQPVKHRAPCSLFLLVGTVWGGMLPSLLYKEF